ncbi:Uncharacterised protein [Mycobacterium tuberculosis]|nr:Uncharacterised protein [Mycobacterium tuberculosis]
MMVKHYSDLKLSIVLVAIMPVTHKYYSVTTLLSLVRITPIMNVSQELMDFLGM